MHIILSITVVFLLLFCCNGYQFAQDSLNDNKNLEFVISQLNLYKESLISARASYEVHFNENQSDDKESELQNRRLYSKLNWIWERDTGRERLEGEWYYNHENQWRSQDLVVAFDGIKQSGYSLKLNNGRIGSNNGVFNKFARPIRLVGYEIIFNPTRDLLDIVKNAKNIDIQQKDNEIDLTILVAENAEETTYVYATLDSQYNYIPVHVKEIVDLSIGPLKRQYVSREYILNKVEMFNNIYFPTKGNVTYYYIKSLELDKKQLEEASALLIKYPIPTKYKKEGISRKNWPIPLDEATRIAELDKFEVHPLGIGTMFYEIDPKSVKLNEMYPDSTFKIDFPNGILLFDEEKRTSNRVGGLRPDE